MKKSRKPFVLLEKSTPDTRQKTPDVFSQNLLVKRLTNNFITDNGKIRFEFENTKALRSFLQKTIANLKTELMILELVLDMIPNDKTLEKLGDSH